MIENAPQLYEVTIAEFVGTDQQLVDTTVVASCTMVDHSGALCVFGPTKAPVAMIAHGYWASIRFRPLEKGEMQ